MKEITYTERDYNGIKIIDLSGSLNSNSIRNFEIYIKKLLEKENLMLNLTNVTLITTAGLSTLIDISYFAKDKGKRIVILWASDDLVKMADTVDVYNCLIFADSPEEGRTKIRYYT